VIPLLEMTFDELTSAVVSAGLPAYRARQLAEWVYKKFVTDPAAMTNVPNAVTELFDILTSRTVARADSTDGTVKLLLELRDGENIECVSIPTAKRHTACVSTQVGCAMGCGFCASSLGGLKRNLTSGEILEQIIHLAAMAGRRVTNVVLMGMGEPLANYKATVAAIRAMIDPQRLDISARHITVSTVGMPAQIDSLARENLPITLAISLHAPNDDLRRRIIPAARRTTITEVLGAARRFYEARRREVTIEYVLLGGVNDTKLCAVQLARLAAPLRCKVNLIACNAVEGMGYRSPTKAEVKAFAARLAKEGAKVNIRHPRGSDIAAACGQLRRRPQHTSAVPHDPSTE